MILFFVDEELDQEVRDFIDYDFKEITGDNAYIYLWGIDLISENPYEDGMEILKQVNFSNENYKYEFEPYDATFLDKYEYIKTFNPDFFCTFSEPECLDRILTDSHERKAQFKNNQLIYKRYQQFFTYTNFHPLHNVNFDSPLPSFRMLSSGHQLGLIDMMEYLDSGDVTTFYKLLNDGINLVKKKLEQAETLISKMALLSMLDRHVDFTSQLIQTGRIESADPRLSNMLKSLTRKEVSITSALKYDLSNWMKLQQSFFENPHYLNKPSKNSLGSTVVNLFLPMAFKPNLTLNIMYHQSFKPVLGYVDVNPEKYYEHYASFDAKAKYPPLRGFLSNHLASFNTDNMNSYLEYQASLFSMDLGIQLLRAFTNEGSWDKVIEKAEQGHQPYLNQYDQSPPFIENGQICYSGLFENTSRFRCLNIIN